MSKVDELINMLNNDDSVIKYRELEKYINTNQEYINLTDEVKKLQKNYVNNPTNENKLILQEYQTKLIEDINISRYLEYIEDINEKIQIIIKIINDEIKV